MPDEKVIWFGRPHSRLGYAMKQRMEGLGGLAFGLFTLAWMIGVVRGSGNWDRGWHVPPFAPHNVAIASLFGFLMLPWSLFLTTTPIRAWWRASSTAYVLTNRRALICEPRVFGGFAIRDFPADSLGGMECSEGVDRTGDLILGSRQTMVGGMTRPDGFLAICEVRAVEVLVRKTLGSQRS